MHKNESNLANNWQIALVCFPAYQAAIRVIESIRLVEVTFNIRLQEEIIKGIKQIL